MTVRLRRGPLASARAISRTRNDTGTVIVGAVVDRVARHRLADAKVIVMGIDQDSLASSGRVGPGQDATTLNAGIEIRRGIFALPEAKRAPLRAHESVPLERHSLVKPLRRRA